MLEDDLERPLRLAIRSTRLLGGASAGYGIFFVFAYGYLNRYESYQLYFIIPGMLLWVIPGGLLLVNAYQLEQRRRRAAIAAMVIASIQGICAAAVFVAQFFLPPMSPVPVLLNALWIAGNAQLVMHLRQSLRLLEMDVEKRHGFEVTPVHSIDNLRPKLSCFIAYFANASVSSATTLARFVPSRNTSITSSGRSS
jgi:hypothetical protein